MHLYIHVPFCDGKCPYCDFYSNRGNETDMDAYTESVKKHVAQWGEKLKGRQVDTLYFGGGTPSLLGGKRLLSIANAVRESFNVTENAEITVEVNPRSSNGELFALLKEGKINRISLGAQSFNEDELKVLGRRHAARDIENTVFEIGN